MTEEEKKGEGDWLSQYIAGELVDAKKKLIVISESNSTKDQNPKETRERVKSLQITLEDRRQHHE